MGGDMWGFNPTNPRDLAPEWNVENEYSKTRNQTQHLECIAKLAGLAAANNTRMHTLPDNHYQLYSSIQLTYYSEMEKNNSDFS